MMMRKLAFSIAAGAIAAGPLAAVAAPLGAHNQPTAEARSTMVFFPWGKPEIDRDAAAILDRVVAAVGGNPAVRIRIDGHSDRSGPAAANRRTSLRRADAVRAYFAQRGVAPSAMSTAGHGEDQPIIATEDGVREPQNRRVEIYVGQGSGQ